MSALRVLIVIFILLLLGAALSLYYVQRNLAALSETQLEGRLSGQGVEDVSVGEISLSGDRLTVASLELTGLRDGLYFSARLHGLQANYSIASLRAARLLSVQVDQLELDLDQRAPATTDSGIPALRLSDWLSAPLNTLLPAETLEVGNVQLSYRSDSAPPLNLKGRLKISTETTLFLAGEFAASGLRLDLANAGGTTNAYVAIENDNSSEGFLQLSGALKPTSQRRWLAEVDLTAQHAALVEWLRRIASDLEIPRITTALEPLSLAGKSSLETAFTLPDLLPLEELLAGRMPHNIALKSQLESDMPEFSVRGTLPAARGTLQLQAQHQKSRWSIIGSGTMHGSLPGASLPLPEDILQRLGWQGELPFSLQLAQGLEFNAARSDSGAWQWEAFLREAEIALGTTSNQIRATALSGDARADAGTAGPLTLNAETTVEGLLSGRKLPPAPLTLEHSGTLEESRYRLQVRDKASSLSLQFAGSANLRRGSGEHTLTLNIPNLGTAGDTVAPLLQRFRLVDSPPELTAGTLALNSQLTTTSFNVGDWRQRATLVADKVSGIAGDIAFTDLAVDAAWQGIESWQTTRPLQLSIARIQPGFSISGLQATLRLPEPTPVASPRVVLEAFSAQMFGGRVFLPDSTTWDFAAPRNTLTLRAEDWSLSELVDLQTNRNIQAQGRLSGELPLILSGQRLLIQSGFLRASPPGGHIRYQPEASTASLAAGNSELDMALALLRDFRFDQLSSSVDLNESGELTLGLALSGSNPAQYQGREINFNINVQQNIDPLLQSLRMSDTLVKDIESGMR
tara:strand:- start:2704 stop:5103 length:2400 start_codon:yes stop_codon:yes gene_type:complete